MMTCNECKGKGYLANNQPLNLPGGVTFTAPTQVPETKCPSCLGNGYQTNAGGSDN